MGSIPRSIPYLNLFSQLLLFDIILCLHVSFMYMLLSLQCKAVSFLNYQENETLFMSKKQHLAPPNKPRKYVYTSELKVLFGVSSTLGKVL